jgi:hypothetical protein
MTARSEFREFMLEGGLISTAGAEKGAGFCVDGDEGDQFQGGTFLANNAEQFLILAYGSGSVRGLRSPRLVVKLIGNTIDSRIEQCRRRDYRLLTSAYTPGCDLGNEAVHLR